VVATGASAGSAIRASTAAAIPISRMRSTATNSPPATVHDAVSAPVVSPFIVTR
jgi:hypothetical protein